MQTILKTFRLPPAYVHFLENNARKQRVSQTEVLIKFIEQMMKKQEAWREALSILATDKKYQKEQIELAEENYE